MQNMQKKLFPIFSIVLLLISLVAPGIQPVAAEEKEVNEYKDGSYSIPMEVLDAKEDKPSAMNSFLKDEEVPVTITDGKAEVTATFTSADMIKHFEVNGTDAEIVDENEEEKVRTYSFEIDNLDEIAKGKVAVEVPGVYDTTHDIRIQFDTNNLPVVEGETEEEESEEPVESEEPEVPDDSEGTEDDGESGSDDESENSDSNDDSSEDGDNDENENESEKKEPEDEKINHKNLDDGTYSIDYSLLHETNDNASSASGYLIKPASLVVEDDLKTVYFTLTDHEAIKDFKLEHNGELKSTTIVEVNENENSRLVAMEVDDLGATLKSQFKVSIPSMDYDAKPFARIQFNVDSIKKTNEDLPKPEIPTKPESLEEGGAYTMNMRVLKEESFEKSPVGSYIKMPIDLTVNKDKNVALLTLLNSNKVKDFKVKKEENSTLSPLITLRNLSKVTQGDYQSVPVIKVDEKNDERIIALEVDDLDGQVEALVSIDNDGEVTDHSVRLFFEENSIRESEGLPVEDLDKVETPVDPEPEYTEEYDLEYTFFEKGKDNPSSMDGFKKGPAKIKEDKDGNYLVTMEFTSGNMIEYIKINDVEADVVKEYKEDDITIKVFEIELKDLSKKYDVKVYVDAGIYSKEHEVDLVFGKELEEEPEPEYIEEYDLDYTFFEKGKDNTSSMDGFKKGPAKIKEDKDGNYLVTMEFTSGNMIEYIKINDVEADVVKEYKEDDVTIKVFEIELKDLSKKYDVKVYVDAGIYSKEHEVDLVFGKELEEEPEPEYTEEYDLDYTFFEKGKDNTSSMDGFKKGPAKIKEDKDGNYLATMEFTSGNMIEYIKVNDVDAKVVKEYKENDETIKVFEVELKDLTKKYDVKVFVNAGIYSQEHEVDLVFGSELEPEGTSKKASSGDPTSVNGNDTLNVETSNVSKGSQVSIKMPANLPEDTTMTVEVIEEDKDVSEDYQIAGAIVDVTVTSKEELIDGKYTLTLPYDTNKFKASEVGIYYYDANKKSWILQEDGKVDSEAGTITLEVDGFSKYGVLVETGKEEPKPEPNPEYIKEYDLGYTFYEKGKDNTSSMDGFKKGPAQVKEDKDGNYLVTMEFTSGEMIEYLKINDVDAKVVKEYKEKDVNIKAFEVKLKDLTKKHDVKVFVDAGIYSKEHEVDLVFDKIGSTPKPEPKPDPNPTPKPKPIVEPTKDDNGKGKGKSKKDKVENYNFFTIDYNFYKPGTTEASVMQDFTEKGPALIRENKKNGNYNVTMTFTNGDMIKEFAVNGNSATVIKNEKGNKTVDFVVKDLDKTQKVKAKIEVPGLYSETYEVDLVFDLGSKKKLDEKDVPGWLKEYIESLTVGQGGSGGSGGLGKTTTEDPGPDFDRDADGNIIGSSDDSGSSINPKTADLNMTQIMLFGSLLLLSLIPLAIKLRRRFVVTEE